MIITSAKIAGGDANRGIDMIPNFNEDTPLRR